VPRRHLMTQWALAIGVMFGALGMHGLVSAEAADGATLDPIVEVAILSPAPTQHHGSHGSHPSSHDLLLCVWVIAGVVAVTLAHRYRMNGAGGLDFPAMNHRAALVPTGHERGPPWTAAISLMVQRR
jgi:hypothetical protein